MSQDAYPDHPAYDPTAGLDTFDVTHPDHPAYDPTAGLDTFDVTHPDHPAYDPTAGLDTFDVTHPDHPAYDPTAGLDTFDVTHPDHPAYDPTAGLDTFDVTHPDHPAYDPTAGLDTFDVTHPDHPAYDPTAGLDPTHPDHPAYDPTAGLDPTHPDHPAYDPTAGLDPTHPDHPAYDPTAGLDPTHPDHPAYDPTAGLDPTHPDHPAYDPTAGLEVNAQIYPPPPSADPPPLPKSGEIGHVALMRDQPKAKYDAGRRTTENEHVIPAAQLRLLTTNPLTGESDFTDAHYRGSATVRVERKLALEKTHGGALSDNERTAYLRAHVAAGESIDVNEHLLASSLDEAERARKHVDSHASAGAIVHAALSQLGDLFGIQRLDDTAAKLRAFVEQLRESDQTTETKSARCDDGFPPVDAASRQRVDGG